MIVRRFLPVLLGLVIVAAASAATMTFVDFRTDMADFLPPGSTPASRFLFRELQSGTAATLILLGIENAPPEELARISRATLDGMAASHRFTFVANGAQDFEGGERDLLLKYRYLLSGRTTQEAFTAPRLRQNLEELLQGLASSAGPLLKRFGFADPTGAFFDVVKTWIGSSQIEQRFGVWFAADGGRALLIAKSAAAGLDIDAQRASVDAIRAAFAGASPGAARLLVTGPAVFSLDAADAIRADVHFITLLSAALILAFLLWQYRSPVAVAAIAIPLGISVAAAAAAVQLVYGFLHGITLGFGMTMLGVTVDYPILLLSQRRPEESPQRTIGRIWPTMRLAAIAAALGLTGMLLSSFPGLSQLGLFSVVGVVTAAVVTRWLLPHLIETAGIRPMVPPTRLLQRLERLRVRRAWAWLPLALAAGYLLVGGGPAWETDLANLSPIPEQQRDLDGELRRQLGAPDVRYLIAVRADDAEGVLQRVESLDAPLAELVRRGAIGGAEDAARYLPSRRTQLLRQAALPEREELAAALGEAEAGLPFRPGAFQPFLDGVAASRQMAPLTRNDIASPVIAARIDPFLFRRDGEWYGVVAISDVRDPTALAALVEERHDPALAYIDIKNETNGVAASYTGEAARWVGIGGLAVLAALLVGLRPRRAVRVALPIAGALLLTLASLSLLQVKLTLFHLVSLLLMVGVSLDYALFFNREAGNIDDAARTFRSLVNCNVTTLTTFGLLTLCMTPVLRGIGSTVALGVLYSIALAFLFADRVTAATGRA